MAYMNSGHNSLLPAWKEGRELIWQCRVSLVQVIASLVPLALPFGQDMLPDGLPGVIVRLVDWLDILEINCCSCCPICRFIAGYTDMAWYPAEGYEDTTRGKDIESIQHPTYVQVINFKVLYGLEA